MDLNKNNISILVLRLLEFNYNKYNLIPLMFSHWSHSLCHKRINYVIYFKEVVDAC